MKSLLPMEIASILVIRLEDIPDSVYDGSFVVMHSAGHIQIPQGSRVCHDVEEGE